MSNWMYFKGNNRKWYGFVTLFFHLPIKIIIMKKKIRNISFHHIISSTYHLRLLLGAQWRHQSRLKSIIAVQIERVWGAISLACSAGEFCFFFLLWHIYTYISVQTVLYIWLLILERFTVLPVTLQQH